MGIAAHLGVLDEAELISRAVEHLFRIGVDHVVAFDMGSTDGTLDVLGRYEGPRLQVVRLSYDLAWEDLHRMTLESVRRTLAEWTLFLDADEFWLPATGSIRDCTALVDHDIVTVERFNVVATDAGPAMPIEDGPGGYGQTFLYARPIPDFRQYMETHPDTPWISGVPLPKVITRTDVIGAVAMGGHDVVTADGDVGRRTMADDVVIAHIPVSTLDRFKRRVANITRFLTKNADYFQGAQGWHWRRLHELSVQGRVREEYDRQLVDGHRLQELVASGSVRTVSQLLRTH